MSSGNTAMLRSAMSVPSRYRAIYRTPYSIKKLRSWAFSPPISKEAEAYISERPQIRAVDT